MAADIDEAYIRPRGRVMLAPTLAPDARWRERLLHQATTHALRLEHELSLVAARALASGWPVARAGGGPFPEHSLVGLRLGWIAWYEDGIEHIGPDWCITGSGRVVDAEGRAIPTEELAAALVRLDACDGLGPPEARRRAFDAQVELTGRNVDNGLSFLARQLGEGPRPVAPGTDAVLSTAGSAADEGMFVTAETVSLGDGGRSRWRGRGMNRSR